MTNYRTFGSSASLFDLCPHCQYPMVRRYHNHEVTTVCPLCHWQGPSITADGRKDIRFDPLDPFE